MVLGKTLNVTYDFDLGNNMVIYNDDGTVNKYNLGDISWIIAASALVWIMIPGLGFFYSGLLRRKNAASMLWAGMVCVGVVSFQWFFWGFSLAFAEDASRYIGTLKHFGMKDVLGQPSVGSPRIPSLLFALYQLMFAAITPLIAVGGIAERGRLGPMIVFIFVWSTIVYDPIACWTWNPNGWSFVMGGLDFAGGTPVHISSGTAALALSFYLPKRRGWGTERLAYKPHNVSYVVLGTVLLWFGWFGFNGGSALGANLRAIQACIVTNLAAAVGGMTWMFWDWRLERKWSVVGFCSGAVSGLVGITPASGFVGAPAAVAIGVLTATGCNFGTKLKHLLKVDDALDIYAAHGIGGFIGNVLTGLFAQSSVAAFDGIAVIPGGWLDHHWIQLGYQLADGVSGTAYSFVMTTAIIWIMHYIPGLRIALDDPEAEILGMDDAEMGEFAYDYVSIEAELTQREELAGGPEHHRGGAGNMESGGPLPHPAGTRRDSISQEKVTME